MTKQEISIYSARFDYLSILKAGLKEWLIKSETEQKKMNSLIAAIEKYRRFIVDEIEQSYQQEIVEQNKSN